MVEAASPGDVARVAAGRVEIDGTPAYPRRGLDADGFAVDLHFEVLCLESRNGIAPVVRYSSVENDPRHLDAIGESRRLLLLGAQPERNEHGRHRRRGGERTADGVA